MQLITGNNNTFHKFKNKYVIELIRKTLEQGGNTCSSSKRYITTQGVLETYNKFKTSMFDDL